LGLRYAAVLICGVLAALLARILAQRFSRLYQRMGPQAVAISHWRRDLCGKWRPVCTRYAATLLYRPVRCAWKTRPNVIEALVNFKVQGQLLAALSLCDEP